jgi:phage terminase Nu1 subunit (DNA packaging protein)
VAHAWGASPQNIGEVNFSLRANGHATFNPAPIRGIADRMVDTEIVTAAQLSDLLHLNADGIRRWARQGVLVKTKDGTGFKLRESVRSYCAHLQEMAAGRIGHDLDVDLIGASANLKREQAELAKTRRLILSGALIPIENVLPVWQRTARAIRQACLAIPSRCRARLPHWSSHDQMVVESEIREALTQLGTNPPPLDDADLVEA